MATDERLYVYAWANNAKRAALRGRACRIVASGTRLNSVLVEFVDDGRREVVSSRALRRGRAHG